MADSGGGLVGPGGADFERWVAILARQSGPIAQGERLCPVRVCHAIVGAWDLRPAGTGAAARTVQLILGMCPARTVADPETYTKGLISVLQDLPADLHATAADQITRRCKTFLPWRGQLHELVMELMAERRAVVARAKRHLAEHERRRAEAAAPRVTDAQRAEMNARMDELKRSLRATKVMGNEP